VFLLPLGMNVECLDTQGFNLNLVRLRTQQHPRRLLALDAVLKEY